MDVLRITPRGFCHGVVDAIRLANEAGSQHQGPVYMLGYLVHNAHVVNELAENGVQLVDFDDRMAGLDQIQHGTVILTAHGVSPAVKQRAIDKGLTVIDATCSDVYITHDLIIDLTSRGYEIIYVGKRGHPEPDGAIGEAPGHVHLVSTPEDVKALDLDNDLLAVTTQTTLSIWDTQDVIDAVVAKYPHVEVHNDICLATQDRQEAAVQAAEVCDLVIVVGSDRSSNSHRLVEVVR
ncbi:MAG: 4-hydroxy-3-methylbut-2-enyl diphosphate reductase, partial [Chloroflexota bacterium]|nr:4-hydroxy-3-methylbut-2-enyl diphosphate reductase [Chloroflexota bacterium]